jgi:HAD superfamily hydrolase (TIGR01484 family)
MKNLNDFNLKTQRHTQTNIQFVLTDIDDTLTTDGKLPACAYESLWQLHNAGFKVIPITGRPAGWCEMIARFWPVAGVVGENGGFYFRYYRRGDEKNKKMQRWFFADDKTIHENKLKLKNIETDILKSVPGCAVSSDQFSRLMDLAIDFCEDVEPLPKSAIDQIVNIFESFGAIAKVSSIHVNGWFGDYNKVTTTLNFLKNEFGLSESDALNQCVFVGDSPNDEPMFEKFPLTFGVGNLKNFSNQMKFIPTYISDKNGGEGFSQIITKLLTK